MPPISGMPPPALFFSGSSATMASVVINSPATDAAPMRARASKRTLQLRDRFGKLSRRQDYAEAHRVQQDLAVSEAADHEAAAEKQRHAVQRALKDERQRFLKDMAGLKDKADRSRAMQHRAYAAKVDVIHNRYLAQLRTRS